ncbi:D-alanyl-D-alanine carboxypeptidase family protein [Desulfopila sp. IMCC35008]|uniref:M15 family metallopeptidase n=1 Tax=Desulfopila sp. IMCC35008 TaxID=2653858 RepID=UPI0013D012E1|nr:M15 family metallopeptidase [Desulfopila sp. IMCC35008]
MISKAHTHNGTKIYIEKNARDALQVLMDAAKEDGVYLTVNSGFRSYNYQMRIFTRMMREGRNYEDVIRYVAPPGYSQHALGTAIDFYPSNWEFAELLTYTWLQDNAWKYGFKETYPRINESGYPWEAWHWNYIGNAHTAENKAPGPAERPLQ